MAQPVTCDICQAELAVQMLSNLQSGGVIAMGPACLPVFYGQSLLAVMGAGEHKGLPQKCQACRRVHERMTLAAHPAAAVSDDLPGNVKNGPGPHGGLSEDDQAEQDSMNAEPDWRGGKAGAE